MLKSLQSISSPDYFELTACWYGIVARVNGATHSTLLFQSHS